MTNGELMDILIRHAKLFSAAGVPGIRRNKGLCGDPGNMTQEQCDAVITGFANHLGFHVCCMDLALAATDLKETP